LKSVDKILDFTTRSWFAFWLTTSLCIGYAIWNTVTKDDFDPYPFIFLTLLLTFFSYLQNIIIMTMQRHNEKLQAVQEDLQRKQALYTLHLMEVVAAQVALLQPIKEVLVEKKKNAD